MSLLEFQCQNTFMMMPGLVMLRFNEGGSTVAIYMQKPDDVTQQTACRFSRTWMPRPDLAKCSFLLGEVLIGGFASGLLAGSLHVHLLLLRQTQLSRKLFVHTHRSGPCQCRRLIFGPFCLEVLGRVPGSWVVAAAI